MANDVFNRGDRVAIRDWDDMVAEYGYYGEHYDRGPINCGDYVFVESMRTLCGAEATIVDLESFGDEGQRIVTLSAEDEQTAHRLMDYIITTAMIRHVDSDDEDDAPDIQEDGFISILSM